MKKIVFLLAAVFMTTAIFANVNQYKINDESVQEMFANASESDFTVASMNFNNNTQLAEKNPWVAFGLCFTVAIGVAGVHRLYLGAGAGVFIGYLCTLGGCGILQSVDAILLLIGAINEDIDKYIDSKKFFLWTSGK